MMPEIWAVIAAGLLGLATVAGGLAMAAFRARWEAIAISARVAALVALIVALLAASSVQEHWSASDPVQAMQSLVAAMLVVHLALAWRLGAGAAGPMVDLVGLVLGLVSVFGLQAGSPELACVQLPALYHAQWLLVWLGGGGVLVAACAGLMLALVTWLSSRGWELQLPGRGPLYGLLAQAAVLAVAVLGSGLVIGVWWAWRTSGTLAWDSVRAEWMAIAWLVAAMSVAAWQLDRHKIRWAAGLALAAAAAVLTGLLFPWA